MNDELRAAAEKRDVVLYVWVKPVNKGYVESLSAELELSMSLIVDSILEKHRTRCDSKRAKLRNRAG